MDDEELKNYMYAQGALFIDLLSKYVNNLDSSKDAVKVVNIMTQVKTLMDTIKKEEHDSKTI